MSEKKQCCGECKYFADTVKNNYSPELGTCIWHKDKKLPIFLTVNIAANQNNVFKSAGTTCPAFTPRKDNEK